MPKLYHLAGINLGVVGIRHSPSLPEQSAEKLSARLKRERERLRQCGWRGLFWCQRRRWRNHGLDILGVALRLALACCVVFSMRRLDLREPRLRGTKLVAHVLHRADELVAVFVEA